MAPLHAPGGGAFIYASLFSIYSTREQIFQQLESEKEVKQTSTVADIREMEFEISWDDSSSLVGVKYHIHKVLIRVNARVLRKGSTYGVPLKTLIETESVNHWPSVKLTPSRQGWQALAAHTSPISLKLPSLTSPSNRAIAYQVVSDGPEVQYHTLRTERPMFSFLVKPTMRLAVQKIFGSSNTKKKLELARQPAARTAPSPRHGH
ncbi:hypothetical protein R3P38DRAFT_2764565 [Favolaschia claudopus]|uniref:Uncharacterized protein n=1 Tax=Favolaschia claudopus TaxID=2862362 RepID=A0AAW0D7B7_9AGAR